MDQLPLLRSRNIYYKLLKHISQCLSQSEEGESGIEQARFLYLGRIKYKREIKVDLFVQEEAEHRQLEF